MITIPEKDETVFVFRHTVKKVLKAKVIRVTNDRKVVLAVPRGMRRTYGLRRIGSTPDEAREKALDALLTDRKELNKKLRSLRKLID